VRKALLLAFVAGLVACATGGTVSAAPLPPTLTGEIFTIGPPTVTASCNPSGTSTVTYAVSGVAIGPYPGTYSETGTVTIGAATLPRFVSGYEAGPITNANISFSIDSPTGQVRGTKVLPAPSTDAFGFCYAPASGGGSLVEVCGCNLSLSYTATIDSGGSRYGDNGTAGLTLDQVQGTVIGVPPALPDVLQQTNTFMESFVSSLLVPFLVCDENSQVNQNQGGNGQGCANP
jgi:hypothetical protein